MNKVHISEGNTKMGPVPSVSLPPGLSCKSGVPCLKGCYAKKLLAMRPSWAKVLQRNWELWTTNPEKYMLGVADYLKLKEPKMFRWHVAGDIPDQSYLSWMWSIAVARYKTKFLVFTKRQDLIRATTKKDLYLPNFKIVLSMWPGLRNNKSLPQPRAWMLDPKNPDPRIPADAKECDGNCNNCGYCWGIMPGQSVVFRKH